MSRSPAERKQLALPTYRYGQGADDVIYAYTADEWGLGGGGHHGGHEQARMLSHMILITVVMAPAALIGAFFTVIFVIGLHWAALPSLFFTLLFAAGVYSGFTSSVHEIKARKLRKARGLPKPCYAVSDDQARNWFEKNPHLGMAITKENFPNAYWK